MGEAHRSGEAAKPVSTAERMLRERLQKSGPMAKLEAVVIGSMEELETFIPDVAELVRVINQAWEEQEEVGDPQKRADTILSEVIYLATYLKALQELLEASEDETLGTKISNARAYLPEKILFFSHQPNVHEVLKNVFTNAFKGEDQWLERLEAKAEKQPDMAWVSPGRFIGSSS